MNDQPTNEQILIAFENAKLFEGLPAFASETHERLHFVRSMRHTWVGKEENDLRFALDNYLRGDS